jgi:hypothetical protein
MATTAPRSVPLPALLVPLAIAAVWGIPRLVVAVLGDASPWTAFFYQYLMGGMVFAIGLLIIRRSGACDFDRPGDRYWYGVLIFGYVWYASMHALIILLAISVPQRS